MSNPDSGRPPSPVPRTADGAHHGPRGRFRNPWPEAEGDGAVRRKFLRMAWEWMTSDLPPDPPPSALPAGPTRIARPRVEEEEVRITWVGHATALIQLPGLNLLTDPVWGSRAGPLGRLGPKRFVPPVPALEDLPPIHAVLLSHDHYDHLDHPTVKALRALQGDRILWCTPLGYRKWLRGRGVTKVEERDWWEGVDLPGGRSRAVAVPARHWTRRTPLGTNRRLWCGWVVVTREGLRIFVGGDSGYCPAFREIGATFGPFHASLLPAGAYEPRWFMKASHMNPEEAVRAYGELGSAGALVAMHWGTFRLTFEDPLEPPRRLRQSWARAGHPPEDLRILRRGETVILLS